MSSAIRYYSTVLPFTPTQSSIALPTSCNSKCFRCIDSLMPSSMPSDFFAVEVARLSLGSAESLYRCLSTIDDSMRKCSNAIKLAYSSQRKMSLDSVSKTNPAPSRRVTHFPGHRASRHDGMDLMFAASRNPRTSLAINNALDCYFFLSSGVAMYCSVRRGGRRVLVPLDQPSPSDLLHLAGTCLVSRCDRHAERRISLSPVRLGRLDTQSRLLSYDCERTAPYSFDIHREPVAGRRMDIPRRQRIRASGRAKGGSRHAVEVG
jgi:hypothetical protein